MKSDINVQGQSIGIQELGLYLILNMTEEQLQEIKWVQMLLTERVSCVRKGEYISNLFNMERGVRQGVRSLHCYLFLK